jgi:hypothetical protein
VGRGDLDRAKADADRALQLARIAKDPQVMWPALVFAARVHLASDARQAGALATEVLSDWKGHRFSTTATADWLAELVEVLRMLGREQDFLESGADRGPQTPWLKAAFAYADGDYVAAAEIYANAGAGPLQAGARLRAADAFVREGRRPEADAQLESALAFWRLAGATAYVREGEDLLAESA